MKDFTLAKPARMAGYPIHRAVAALAQGAPHLWRDNGDTLTIRTSADLQAPATALPEVRVGEMRLFALRASVSRKNRGHHAYAPQGDVKVRQAWLERQAARHGFALVAVHCTSTIVRVSDQRGRDFALDSTDFTGALRVTDAAAFGIALRSGVGSTGKAFGFSLLTI